MLFFVLTIISFSACKEKTNLEAEVMAIHDEVMPKMGAIHVAKKGLRKVLAKIENDSLKPEILALISDLESADEGMMSWMHKWDVPSTDPEKTEYLKKEKDKITKVKVDMLLSLENAHTYLSKTNKK